MLPQECASLADQLIQGQVKRAEEAEEMIEMRKQVSLMKRRISEMDQLGAVANDDRNCVEETPTDQPTQDVEVCVCALYNVCVCVCLHVNCVWYNI